MITIKDTKQQPITGSKHYKAFVGACDFYDIVSADQFNLLTTKGLRDINSLLDFGCGSLRLGRLAIPYLESGRYFGIEPEKWLVKEGINNNLGDEIIKLKKPSFNYNNKFNFDVFNQKFDYIIACSIFSHATQQQIIQALKSVRDVMHDRSIFFASFKRGSQNYTGEKWAYPEVITYTMEWMKSNAKKANLICEKIEWTSPHLQTWVAIVLNSYDKNELKILPKLNAFHIYNNERRIAYQKS